MQHEYQDDGRIQQEQQVQFNEQLEMEGAFDQQDDQQKNKNKNSSSTATISFSVLVRFFQKNACLRGPKKGHYIKEFFKALFKIIKRNPLLVYSILRLVLPSDDRHRGNYGLKEKGLARIISDTIGLKKADYQRLYHYKNPNFHQKGFSIGDFSLCVYDVVKSFCRQSSKMTVLQLNTILDQLAVTNTDHSSIFTRLFQKCSAEEAKWVIRIILKDMKLNIKTQSVLKVYHKDANDYFNLTNNLLEVCTKFQDASVSLSDQISLFNPIRPMLAGKKPISYFKFIERPLYIQTKYDGQRIQAHYNGNNVKLFSRNGINYTHIYKSIVQVLSRNILADSCILDGEIIVLENESLSMVPFGMNKVVALASSENNLHLCYQVFDVLWVKLDGEQINLMKFELKQRKRILGQVFRPIRGILQIVKHKELSKYDDILQEFSDSVERNEEGIMLKDPGSLYTPKERSTGWLKLKGDYVDGLTDTLDLLIIGGYFGDKSYRQGTTGHWTDKITTFLLAVIRKNPNYDPNNQGNNTFSRQPFTAIPFCKVGTGYTTNQLSQLRDKLRTNISAFDAKLYPRQIQSWKYNIQDKPDCWIRNLNQSLILQIKAAQIIVSDSYPTQCTLRFPRTVKMRFDKDPSEALTIEDLEDMRNSQKYMKNMKKKGIAGQKDSDGQQEGQDYRADNGKKSSQASKKLKKDGNQNKVTLLDEFQGCQLTASDLKKSNLFYGLNFVVLSLLNYNRHSIQRQIILNGGNVTQNPLSNTKYIVADHIDYRLSLYQQSHPHIMFIKPKYIIQCSEQGTILPLSPLYLTVLPVNKRNHFLETYDRFSDSYVDYLNQKELNVILDEMNGEINGSHCQLSSQFPINQKLCKVIQLENRCKRENWKCVCIGLRRLDQIKLKINGFQIMPALVLDDKEKGRDPKVKVQEMLEEQRQKNHHCQNEWIEQSEDSKLDSIIIVDANLKQYQIRQIDAYIRQHPQTIVELKEDLVKIGYL